MSASQNRHLQTIFKYNHGALNLNLQDISHEESLQSTEAGENCMNWILGHLIVTRDFIFKALSLPTSASKEMRQMYGKNAEHFTPGQAVALEELLEMYNSSHDRLMKTLPEATVPHHKNRTKNVAALAFHESYHIGQIAIARRLLGKTGAIQI